MIGFGGLNLPGDRYIDPRYRLANALMAGSVQRGPDTHWMQGLGRMSQMLAGAYLASEADRAGQRDQDELYKILGSTEPKVQGPAQGPVSTLPSAPQQPGGRWGRAMQNLLGGVNEYIQETPNQVASARNMLGQGINEINAASEAQEPAGLGGGGSGTVLPEIKPNAFAMPEFKRTRDDFLLEKLQMAVDMGNRAARPMLIQMQNRIAQRDARREEMLAQMRFQMGMKEEDRAYQDLREDDIYRRNRKDALSDKAADREFRSDEAQKGRDHQYNLKVWEMAAKPPTPGRDVPYSKDVYDQKLALNQALAMGKPMTEGQSNAATYADRMKSANRVIGNFENAGTDFWQNLAKKFPGGNYLLSDEFQQLEQAKRDFVNAVLRRESGAVISEQEFENAEKQYFPQPGDSAAVINQKKKNRETALSGIQRSAGPKYQIPPDKAENDPLGIR